MESMKNIKPAYATKLGTGVFVGATWVGQNWQCSKCGLGWSSATKPAPTFGGRCPATPTGNHIWKKI